MKQALLILFLTVAFVAGGAGGRSSGSTCAPQEPGNSSKDGTESTPAVSKHRAHSRKPGLSPLSSKAPTRVLMRNVDFHSEESIVLRIRNLRGGLLRKDKSIPPTFDDKSTFILRIDSGIIGVSTDSLNNVMNDHVFNYPKAPLKEISISTEGSQIKMKGKMHKAVWVPFEIVGGLSATPEGKIRLHPSSIKAEGVPVKSLLHLFGAELDDLIKGTEAHGVKIEGDDIILDPERITPPPEIRGKVTAVWIDGDEVVQGFGGGKKSSGRVMSANRGPNFMYFRGGILRFGKLTMRKTDLKIIDANQKDVFDFSIDNYNRQLVAGYTKNKPNYGLVVFMPDYLKIKQRSTTQSAVSNSPRKLRKSLAE
jgi:hypothetical protein